MITVATTKAELKAKWKQMYQTRKAFAPDGVLPGYANYGYFTGKMEYTAWLLLHSTEQPTAITSHQPEYKPL